MKHRVGPGPQALLWFGLIALAGATGCAAKHTIAPVAGPLKGIAPAEADARAEAVRSDPRAYLYRVAEKCRALEQYTLTFTRQERRGLFRTLRDPEHIACKFRRKPFSIYMKWMDPDIKYGESTYVEAEQGNKVRFVPRHGLFGLAPRIKRVGLRTPVIWGEAKYPLTDFGLERMMERTLGNVERAGDDVAISYHGLTKLSESDRVVHYVRLDFPPSQHKAPVQELFIDVQTDLPVCTRILYSSGKLEAAYVWDDVDPSVALTDEDFLLDAERELGDEQTQSVTVEDTQ
ncbi:MAG: DUF1571 domain-containing protein [Phycisphaerae bacterium]